MDPISTFILTQIADTIIGTLAADGTQEIISQLQGNPTKKALKKALGEALTRYVASQPERKIIAEPLLRRKSLLAEKDIANELAQVVKFVRAPDVVLIGKRWHDELANPPSWRDFTNEAKLLIDYFTDELKATPTFAPVFEVATLDSLAAYAEVSAESLASIEKLLGSFISLIDSQFETLAQRFAGASTGVRERIRDFSLYITEKTGSFVGRHFLFQEIQEFIDTNMRGYFLLYGDPGIGKSAISAQLVKEHGYIHYFNIRADGINEASDFLRSICAQLIAVYSLDYPSLPPETTQDAGFLNRLLNEVSEKTGQSGKCVIVVDALDEAAVLSPPSGVNVLSLPRVLPPGIFIVATSRREPKEKIRLRIDIPEQIERDLRQDEPGNSADIAEYIQGQVRNPGLQAYIHRQQIDDELFVGYMLEKAQGNFIYLRYVLPEIERGHYQDLALDQLPRGLQNYYESHWNRIKLANGLDWFDYRLPVILALTVMKKPVPITLIIKYSEVNDKRRVNEVLHDFDQFLYKIGIEYDRQLTTCYRWYHASFFDFISRKEEVADEVVDLRKANEKVVNKMWTALMGDIPISKRIQE
jgi:ATPase family associated with various cellular activities (AAA)